MRKNSYDQFREWLMSCPVKYEQDDLKDLMMTV